MMNRRSQNQAGGIASGPKGIDVRERVLFRAEQITVDARAREMRRSARTNRRPLQRRVEPRRVLATILFVDIVRSTEKAALLGDPRWNQVLSHYYAALRRELRPARGTEV